MNLKSILLALAMTIVTGCEKVEQIGTILADEPLTITFLPGYRIAVNGVAVMIQGLDECPKPNPSLVKLFGPYSNDGKHKCVVIKPSSTEVSVQLALSTGITTELWKVRHERDSKINLQRPNGFPVIGWNNDEIVF